MIESENKLYESGLFLQGFYESCENQEELRIIVKQFIIWIWIWKAHRENKNLRKKVYYISFGKTSYMSQGFFFKTLHKLCNDPTACSAF